jgi:hypothetical protein
MRRKDLVRSAQVAVETGLAQLGRRIGPRAMYAVDVAVNYLHAGYWLRQRSYSVQRWVGERRQLFDLVAGEVRDARVLYLEFGVFRGSTMGYWSEILTGQTAELHGFDTFEGLPQRWNPDKGEGFFSTEGAVPRIDDPRVHFHKGMFQDTLPEFEWPDHDVLVVNMDADLYSSTIFVLRQIEDRLVPGSYLYFDEFMDRNHELRAFEEFVDETGARFEVRAATKKLDAVLFQRRV